ncbi:transposase family protein [Chondrinema litorale]|uniref:transposase family protein n=1 Tax=Chondrinema litorale TaxID=2994555 RepID=UPI003D6E83D9
MPSYAYHGRYYDLSILRNEFDAGRGLWFGEHEVHVDFGYLGLDKDYGFKKLSIPYKKKRNKTLTEQQQTANSEKSQFRVIVENSIAGLKRYRFLSDRLRCRKMSFYNKVIGLCAGLWNFLVTY